jgi:hypothetical protein
LLFVFAQNRFWNRKLRNFGRADLNAHPLRRPVEFVSLAGRRPAWARFGGGVEGEGEGEGGEGGAVEVDGNRCIVTDGSVIGLAGCFL